jgi:DNA-binding response OmpR family regulator
MPRTPRILIVDDFPDIAETLGRLFRFRGYEVRTATDGLQAIPIAEQFRPEFVLLDIGMPNLNGFETAKRIRSKDWSRGMTLIALSSHWSRGYQRRAREAGFDRYLFKPMPAKNIAAVIEKLSDVDNDGQTAFNFPSTESPMN